MTVATSPAPFLEVTSGSVRAVIPDLWDARPLGRARLGQEGFVASPRIDAWERGVESVQGMEAFWVDGAKLRIPSDYYYLAARGSSLRAFLRSEACRSLDHEVVLDHPPDVTGARLSAGDYVARSSGTCRMGKRSARWSSVVVAPGFGPLRRMGIPSSGLYVVVAVVAVHRAEVLDEMIHGATFGGSRITEIVRAAGDLR